MRSFLFLLVATALLPTSLYAEVKPTNAAAYLAVLNTLTSADQSYVKLDKNGVIDRDLINGHSSLSGNYNALKLLVRDNRIIEVIVSNDFKYKDKTGAIKWGKIGVKYSNELESSAEYTNKQYTREQLKAMGFEDKIKRNGTHGITLLPGGENDADGDGKGSEGNNIVVILSRDLTQRDAARSLAHEGYGTPYSLYWQRIPITLRAKPVATTKLWKIK